MVVQAGDPVAVREPGAGADVRVPGGAGRAGAAAAAQDLRRERAGAAAVRHPAHRRARLASQHALQGRLPRQPHRRAVVLEGTSPSTTTLMSCLPCLISQQTPLSYFAFFFLASPFYNFFLPIP